MKIIADEEEDSVIVGGGEISPEDKSKYKDSYYGIIQARKDGDKEKEKECADKLLAALRAYLDNEIKDLDDKDNETIRLKEEGFKDEQIQSMLFTNEEIESIKQDLNEIWTSIDPNETDYILKVNLVSIQCSCLFSVYAKNVKYEEVNFKDIFSEIDYKNYNVLKNYFNTKTIFVKQTKYLRYLSYTRANVAGYSNENGFETYYLINMLPYISTTEMMDAWFEKNIWMIGFSTRYQYADNDYYSPIGFLNHDYQHAYFSKKCYDVPFGGNRPEPHEEKEYPYYDKRSENYKLISEFYGYVKNKYNADKPKLYSIKLIIFMGFHELGDKCEYYFTNASNTNSAINTLSTKLDISNRTDMVSRFFDENDLYLSLPSRIRKEIEKDSEKKGEIIVNYINGYCLTNFINALEEFQKSKGLIKEGKGLIKEGGKKTKKRKTRRNKKRRKTRRTV